MIRNDINLLICNVLGVESIEIEKSFIEHGVESLRAAMILTEINDKYSLAIEFEEFRRARTIKEFIEHVYVVTKAKEVLQQSDTPVDGEEAFSF